MSKTCQASVIHVSEDDKRKLVKESIPVPMPGPGQALVRVQYVAQNPTDGKFI
jgi:NADPH:quinone reductase-like Zn-dependent oxidoreductase